MRAGDRGPRLCILTRPLCLFLSVTVGCATAGTQTVDIAPARQQQVENEATVPGSSDVTWDRLVQRLSRGYYVINNIDKASRLINISFSSNAPQDYIDCGTTTRTYTRGEEHEEYKYPLAQSSSYRMGEQRSNAILTYRVNRQTELEGRANIYVAPKDSVTTSVIVNVRYALSIRTTGTYQVESLIGIKGETGPIAPSSSTISFNTNQPNSTNMGTAESPAIVSCYSRGTLERELIAFGKP